MVEVTVAMAVAWHELSVYGQEIGRARALRDRGREGGREGERGREMEREGEREREREGEREHMGRAGEQENRRRTHVVVRVVQPVAVLRHCLPATAAAAAAGARGRRRCRRARAGG